MIFGPFLIENTINLSETTKFYDFVFHLLQTVWKNIEKEKNTGMSKLMGFYGTPGIQKQSQEH